MSRTLSRRTLIGGTLVAAQSRDATAAPTSKPNVIVILFDDLGVHDFGYIGARDLKTPHIDRLAAGGTVCRNWYDTTDDAHAQLICVEPCAPVVAVHGAVDDKDSSWLAVQISDSMKAPLGRYLRAKRKVILRANHKAQ